MQYIGLLTHRQKQAGYFVSQDDDFVWLFRNNGGSPLCIAVWLYAGLTIKTVRDKAQGDMVRVFTPNNTANESRCKGASK